MIKKICVCDVCAYCETQYCLTLNIVFNKGNERAQNVVDILKPDFMPNNVFAKNQDKYCVQFCHPNIWKSNKTL